MHLWEIEHPYYCNEGNYYASGLDQPVGRYESWQEFHDENGDADFDMNLVFRFDWLKRSRICDDCEGRGCDTCDQEGETKEQFDVLLIFWMGQRKGLYRWSEVAVEEADEEQVRAWLEPRFAHLKQLWEPLG